MDVETQGASSLGGLLLEPALEEKLEGQPQGERLAGSPHQQHSGGAATFTSRPPPSWDAACGGEDGRQTAEGLAISAQEVLPPRQPLYWTSPGPHEPF